MFIVMEVSMSPLSDIRIYSDGSVEIISSSPPPVTPAISNLVQVYYDYDQKWTADNGNKYHVSRPTRNGASARFESLPATANFRGTANNVPMTQDIQIWIHEINMARNPSLTIKEGKNAFSSLFRDDAYATNFAGTSTRADYVNLVNLDQGLPMLIPMGCGGTVFRQVGERDYHGEPCWVIETMSNTENYRQYTPQSHPWLFYIPSSSARRKVYKTVLGLPVWFGVWNETFSNPFSQYKNPIMPIITFETKTALIPKWRCHTLAIGESPKDYTRG
jgi:hypothetical protein